MTFEVGAVLHLRFLRIPDAQSTISGARGDEMTVGAPGDSADPCEFGMLVRGLFVGIDSWD